MHSTLLTQDYSIQMLISAIQSKSVIIKNYSEQFDQLNQTCQIKLTCLLLRKNHDAVSFTQNLILNEHQYQRYASLLKAHCANLQETDLANLMTQLSL